MNMKGQMMKSRVLTKAKASRFKIHVESNNNYRKIVYTPMCHKCGKPMKLKWSDSITGNKQIWSCLECFHYRIINHSSPICKNAP